MAVPDITAVSQSLILQVSQVTLWIKAAGIAALIWVIFESVALWLNYKRWKDVSKIMKDMKRLENKLDKAIKNK